MHHPVASASAVTAFTFAGLLMTMTVASAADPGATDREFFEKKIRPVLTEHCYRCHSAEARQAGKLKAGLLLDSRDGLRTGGASGPAIIPGKPAESLLLKALRYQDELRMPSKQKLQPTAEERQRLLAPNGKTAR